MWTFYTNWMNNLTASSTHAIEHMKETALYTHLQLDSGK